MKQAVLLLVIMLPFAYLAMTPLLTEGGRETRNVLLQAGGIVVLYLFVVMLVNLKRPPEVHQDPRRQARLGLAVAGAVLAELIAIIVYSSTSPAAPAVAAAGQTVEGGNVEQVGWLLYTDYLIPFEVASILLLVAMVGAIVLAKREL